MSAEHVIASLRVTPSSGISGASRPEPLRVQLAASVLRELGFDVVRTGRFGVNVRADPARFESVLGVPASDLSRVSLAITPNAPSLAGLIDYLEVLSTPNPAS